MVKVLREQLAATQAEVGEVRLQLDFYRARTEEAIAELEALGLPDERVAPALGIRRLVGDLRQLLAASQAREATLIDAATEAAEWLESRLDYTEGDAATSSRLRGALAPGPGQAAERVRLLEKIARIAADETDHSPFRDFEWADDHRDLCDALDELAALATPGKGEGVNQ